MKHSCQVYCFDEQCFNSYFLMSYLKASTFKDFKVFVTISYVYGLSCAKAIRNLHFL